MAKQNRLVPRKFILWLIFSAMISSFCLLVYWAVQQDMRLGAYDPQIQMAEDNAVALGAGQSVSINNSVNVATSLAPFMVLYNSRGQVVSSGVKLNGQTPDLPQGVFDVVKANGEARFTWQPQDGVHIATIVTKYNNGFVLAGRNMREVESRIEKSLFEVGLAWVTTETLVTLFIVLL